MGSIGDATSHDSSFQPAFLRSHHPAKNIKITRTRRSSACRSARLLLADRCPPAADRSADCLPTADWLPTDRPTADRRNRHNRAVPHGLTERGARGSLTHAAFVAFALNSRIETPLGVLGREV